MRLEVEGAKKEREVTLELVGPDWNGDIQCWAITHKDRRMLFWIECDDGYMVAISGKAERRREMGFQIQKNGETVIE